MANTGKLQATVAYKVRKGTDIPLDINGDPISESGKKQAIALLYGRPNPNPLLFEVETYFNDDGFISGNPTTEFAPDVCPVGFLRLSASYIVLSPDDPAAIVKLNSSGAWVSSATAYASIVPASGIAGEFDLMLTRTATLGQQEIVFTNIETGNTATLYLVNVLDPNLWILEDGTWNMLGFWFNNGIWNY